MNINTLFEFINKCVQIIVYMRTDFEKHLTNNKFNLQIYESDSMRNKLLSKKNIENCRLEIHIFHNFELIECWTLSIFKYSNPKICKKNINKYLGILLREIIIKMSILPICNFNRNVVTYQIKYNNFINKLANELFINKNFETYRFSKNPLQPYNIQVKVSYATNPNKILKSQYLIEQPIYIDNYADSESPHFMLSCCPQVQPTATISSFLKVLKKTNLDCLDHHITVDENYLNLISDEIHQLKKEMKFL